jgi:hypothetical protein
MLLSGPADYFIGVAVDRNAVLGRVAITVLTGFIVLGIFRHARLHGWQPIHFSLAIYSLVILIWNFPDVDRFLLPFLPLFATGMWLEGKNLYRRIRTEMLCGANVGDKLIAGALGCVFGLMILLFDLNYVKAGRDLSQESGDRASMLEEKREAYVWLSRSTPTDARVIAYEDSAAYLYTGRQTMPPLVFSTADLYDRNRLQPEVSRMTDVADSIGATFWIFADDDFDFTWPAAMRASRLCLNEIEQNLPLVFRSKAGRVRIHAIPQTHVSGTLACRPIE